MMRTVVCSFVTLALLAGTGAAAEKAKKNQMVKGTIKSVDVKNKVLVVSQKVKNENTIVVGRDIASSLPRDRFERRDQPRPSQTSTVVSHTID